MCGVQQVAVGIVLVDVSPRVAPVVEDLAAEHVPADAPVMAMAAACERFTERIVADHYPVDRQRRFVLGLVDLDQRAARTHQKLFIDCEGAEQDAVLAAVEADAYAARADGVDSFWRDLKYLTIYGYYTSEIGIREEQKVPAVPGRWDGCMPVAVPQ